jgi:glycosyltransferase involved in cell wall biosynthesis
MSISVAILTTDKREFDKDYGNPTPCFGTAPEALLQGFKLFPEIKIHIVSCVQQPLASPEKLADNIWYHSLLVPKIGWMRTAYQGCIRATRRKLQALQPDIVHGQGTERDCSLSAVFSGFRNVLTIHGNMRMVARVHHARPFTFLWLAARLEAFTIPRSDGVVCLTNHTRVNVEPLARRTWVLPNAVDESFFEVHASPSPDEPPTLLCVAAVYPLKNQNNLIRALDPLAEKMKFKVVFLGQAIRGNTYTDEFFQLLASRPWCAHAGFADRQKLKAHLKKASILVLPSLEDNCPMVLLEAMAAGVPVVAAKVGGVPDLVADRQTGLFCNPLEVASIRAGVAELLENPSLGRDLAGEAKRRALERFHPRTVAGRHVEIYREVIAGRR